MLDHRVSLNFKTIKFFKLDMSVYAYYNLIIFINNNFMNSLKLKAFRFNPIKQITLWYRKREALKRYEFLRTHQRELLRELKVYNKYLEQEEGEFPVNQEEYLKIIDPNNIKW